MTKAKFLGLRNALLFMAAGSVGLVLGACQEEEPEEIDVSGEIESACMAYCEKFAQCNEETVASECQEKCNGVLYACEQHEQDEALDQVKQCGGEDCFGLPLCTLNAGVQCVTGLGL